MICDAIPIWQSCDNRDFYYEKEVGDGKIRRETRGRETMDREWGS